MTTRSCAPKEWSVGSVNSDEKEDLGAVPPRGTQPGRPTRGSRSSEWWNVEDRASRGRGTLSSSVSAPRDGLLFGSADRFKVVAVWVSDETAVVVTPVFGEKPWFVQNLGTKRKGCIPKLADDITTCRRKRDVKLAVIGC
jgi:hypothetical protein